MLSNKKQYILKAEKLNKKKLCSFQFLFDEETLLRTATEWKKGHDANIFNRRVFRQFASLHFTFFFFGESFLFQHFSQTWLAM